MVVFSKATIRGTCVTGVAVKMFMREIKQQSPPNAGSYNGLLKLFCLYGCCGSISMIREQKTRLISRAGARPRRRMFRSAFLRGFAPAREISSKADILRRQTTFRDITTNRNFPTSQRRARTYISKRPQIGRFYVGIAFALLVMAFSVAQADEKPLTIESSGMQPSLVQGRPMLTWWDVKIQGSSLLVGKLKFTIKDEQKLLAVSETEELTLNGPEQRIRVMLPSIDCLKRLDQLNVDIAFHGKTFNGEISQQILRLPFSKKKVFVGLLADAGTARKNSPERDELRNRLKFENVVLESSAHRESDIDREFVSTFYASVIPVDLPSEPLAYCSYDLVVVPGPEFRSLRKSQLEALLAWIKAGGSAYVEPDGVLEPYHVDFLRNLVADDSRKILFQVDQHGKLSTDESPADVPVYSVALGIGHVVIRTGDPNQEIDRTSESWRAIVRPLWKSRAQILETPLESEAYRQVGLTGLGPQGILIDTNPFSLARSLGYVCRLSQKELLDRLLPEGVQMVPLWLLTSILFIFVLLIGPGDYFVLGWLKLRKLTWVTFPLTTIGVTILTVLLSNSYMTSAESRRTVIVRDVGSSGDIVRTNRFELLFIASSRWVTTEIEKGLFAPFEANSISSNPPPVTPPVLAPQPGSAPVPGTGMAEIVIDLDAKSRRIEGRIPTAFTVHQNMAKWTPQMNRIFSVPGTAEKPNVDWRLFQLPASEASNLSDHKIPPQLVERVQREFGPHAMVACFTSLDGWANDKSKGWFSRRSPQGDALIGGNVNLVINRTFEGSGVNNARNKGESDFFLWLYAMSVGFPGPGVLSPTSGAFSLISRTAPKGSANCDDMPLLDSSDPNEWLLVIAVPDKDGVIVYRKQMHFE